MTKRIVQRIGDIHRWRPAPMVLASLTLHLTCLVALTLRPDLWRWMLGVLAANHLGVLAVVLWPRSKIGRAHV